MDAVNGWLWFRAGADSVWRGPLRRLLVMFAACVVLGTSVARAEGPDPAEEERFNGSQRLGTAGLIVGYTGPILVAVGGVTAIDYMLADNQQQQRAGTRGVIMLMGGFSMNSIGPALLSSSSVVGASAVQNSGGQVSSGMGWAAVAGSGLQILSLGGRFAVPEVGFSAGIAGWGTGMIAGTIQHVQNRKAWAAMGTSHVPAERKHFTVALAPTANGARVFGTF